MRDLKGMHHRFLSAADNTSVILTLDNDVLYAHQVDACMPSASLIKLPIMLLVFDKYYDALDEQIALDTRVEGCGVSPYLSHAYYSVRDMVTMMIACSDNTATNSLIEWLGMDVINQYFKTLGLTETILNRKMMDVERRAAGFDNMTSAYDMMHVLRSITQHRYFEEMFQVMKRQQLKEKTLLYIDETTEMGTKSGEFDDIRHEVGILREDDKLLLFAVLTKNQDAQVVHPDFHSFGLLLQNIIKQ